MYLGNSSRLVLPSFFFIEVALMRPFRFVRSEKLFSNICNYIFIQKIYQMNVRVRHCGFMLHSKLGQQFLPPLVRK